MSPRAKKQTWDGMKALAVIGMVLTLGQQWFSIRGQIRDTQQDNAAVASSVAAVVQDAAESAQSHLAETRKLARLERRIRVLEARIGKTRQVVWRHDTGSLPGNPADLEPPKRGLLSSATGVLGGALRGFGRFLFGS